MKFPNVTLRGFMFWIKKFILIGVLSGAVLLTVFVLPLPYVVVKYVVLAMPEQFIPAMETPRSNSLLARAIGLKLEFDFQNTLTFNDPTLTVIDQASKQVNQVRDLIITQRQLDDVAIYWGSSTSEILVRGFGFCDQINGVLALLLAPSFQQSDLFALKNGERSPHSLVRLRTSNDEYWADAWSDTAIFHMGHTSGVGIPSFDTAQAGFQTTLPDVDETYFDDGFVLNRYDFWSRIEKAVRRTAQKVFPFIQKSASTPDAQSQKTARAVQGKSAPVSQTQQLTLAVNEPIVKSEFPDPYLVTQYLSARIDHLYGLNSDALTGYSIVLKSGCQDDFCRFAQEFSQRLSAIKPLQQ